MPIFLKGQVRFQKDIQRMDEAAQELVRQATLDSANRIAAKARSRAPSGVSGRLKGSIRVENVSLFLSRKFASRIKAVPFYALPVEFGYKGRSGKGNRSHKLPIERVGGKWRVIRPLADWARQKGKPPWAVARHLLAKGRPKHPFLYASVEEERDRYLTELQRIVDTHLPNAGSSTRQSEGGPDS